MLIVFLYFKRMTKQTNKCLSYNYFHDDFLVSQFMIACYCYELLLDAIHYPMIAHCPHEINSRYNLQLVSRESVLFYFQCPKHLRLAL